jgi:hypothetical protein
MFIKFVVTKKVITKKLQTSEAAEEMIADLEPLEF